MDRHVSERISGILVLPIAVIGTFLILDDGGPPGPFGFAEYFGWWAICFIVAWLGGRSASASASGGHRYLALLPGVALPIVLALFLYADVRAETPAGIKDAVEYGQQAIGLIAIVGFAAWLAKGAWSKKRHSDTI